MNRRIVTADDLGLREDVDLGIIRAHRAGAVTHASWLAGGETSREVTQIVTREAPGLGVGLHLSLSQTRPSAPNDRLGGLIRSGRFPPNQFAAVRWAWGRRSRLLAVEAEWEAQADAFEHVWARTPTHLDSHQHVHLAPPFAALAVRLAVRRGIPRIRAPRGGRPGRSLRGRLEARVFDTLGRRLARLATEAGLLVPDAFDGFHASGRVTVADLRAMKARRLDGTTEWMVHPGLRDEPGGYARRQELEALIRWSSE
ncbi:MAG: ChbG/HpnK family deacetylase [Bacteroidota bacterium]